MAYMMMRKRNTSTFKNKTGLGYQYPTTGSQIYGMGRVEGNTFQWYVGTSSATDCSDFQFNNTQILYYYVAF